MSTSPAVIEMTALEQSHIELLARFTLKDVDGRNSPVWQRILGSIGPKNFADGVAHALVRKTNRTTPTKEQYQYAIALAKSYGNAQLADDVKEDMLKLFPENNCL